MTRSFRARRITQPIAVIRRRRDLQLGTRSFTCFRLVPDGGALHPIELVHSTARMFAFTEA
ncbi:MAG TPA: hypothetical protein VMZ53_09825 [Kofleriaceae bacterium]|nr:hypothetical protein [Kofleriaceae bacterium]